MRITCRYRKKKNGLPIWVAPYLITISSFLFWLLVFLQKNNNVLSLLILWKLGLIGIASHLIISYLLSIHSPIKRLRWKRLLQVFSEYSSLISENKPTRWEISSDGDRDIIKFMPTGSISKNMATIEVELSEKLTQFLEIKTKKNWCQIDRITERSSITLIFTHNDLTRKEIEFNVKTIRRNGR